MRLSILFILLIFVFSCDDKGNSDSKKKKNTFQEKFSLRAVDILEFDTLTNFQTKYLERLEINGTEHFAYENRYKPSIQIYNIETKELAHEIFLKKKGPMGIGRIHGFHVHNLDSIFIVSGSFFNVFLVNREGDVIRKFDLKMLLPHMGSDPVSYTTKPIFYDHKNLYFSAAPDKNYDKKGYWDGGIAIKLDVMKEKSEYIFQGPKEYHERIYGAFFSHFSVAQNDDGDFVYAFPFDSELFVTDYKNKYEKHYAGSKYFDKIPEKDENTSHEKHYIEADSYADLLYDKWRKVYYRVAFRSIDMIDQSGNRNTWRDKIPSIIILDEHFRKIGEVDLPKETYHILNNSFVGKKGLYISNNHIKNPNADENKLSFTLFALETL